MDINDVSANLKLYDAQDESDDLKYIEISTDNNDLIRIEFNQEDGDKFPDDRYITLAQAKILAAYINAFVEISQKWTS